MTDKHKVYEELYKLRKTMKKARKFNQEQADIMFGELYDHDKGFARDFPKEDFKYTKKDLQFREFCTKRNMCMDFIAILDDIISRFPEAAKVIYGE